jgi:hypothetical protein
MTTNTRSALGQLSDLSDHDLLAHIHLAAQAERSATVHLVALLIELDGRRLYLGEGFPSLFAYCTEALHLSEGAAYNRIEAARAARRFPIILDGLAAGELTLASIKLLAPHLTPENHREVLTRARHQSKREIELLLAALHPRPDVPSVIRKLPASRQAPPPAPRSEARVVAVEADAAVPVEPPRALHTSARAERTPLTPERYKIQFTVSRQTRDKLRRAQDLLRHAVPTGDPAVIFDRALTLLLTQLERSKTGATDRPRTTGPGPGPVVARTRPPATYPRRRSGSSGSATADAAPSPARTGDVPPQRFSNITMSCRSPRAVRRRRRISSCDAARTISTRQTAISARYTCRWCEKRVRRTA